jgi:hypothetical protein
MKVTDRIATLLAAIRNCQVTGNAEWLQKHEISLSSVLRTYLPSGSGFDAGTTLEREKSSDKKLVFRTAYHHMNGGGYYDGWTEHLVTALPTFDGIEIRVSGRNRNSIKEYIVDVFWNALTQEYK